MGVGGRCATRNVRGQWSNPRKAHSSFLKKIRPLNTIVQIRKTHEVAPREG